MATVAQNQDGTLTVTMSDIEKITYAGLATDELQNYVTQWLDDKNKVVFANGFNALSPENQAAVLAYFTPPGP